MAKSENEQLDNMLLEFYNYMADVYIEYNSIEPKPLIKKPSNKNEIKDISHLNDILNTDLNIDIDNNADTMVIQEFQDYFLYKLYYNYGIKRRIISDKLVLLFYDKAAKGYKPDHLITMLCRHMMLDMSNMRVVSLGITKATKLDNFLKAYNINPDDALTNKLGESENFNEKFRIYSFPEGTMMIYNPLLKKYNVSMTHNIDININNDEQDENEIKHNDEIKEMIEQKFKEQFQYSTRRMVGTGNFNSLKTFFEMFNENNVIANINMTNIPENVLENRILIFNIEHPENKMISPFMRNYNTLCGVYKLKSIEQVNNEWQHILELSKNGMNGNNVNNDIRTGFSVLGKNMICKEHISELNDEISKYGVCFNTPDIVKSFERKKSDGTMEIIQTIDININMLMGIVANKPKTFQGYLIYGINGERTKISNPQYKILKQLKGNRPVVIEQWNIKNLFYLYWRLIKQNIVHQFIKEFDVNGEWTYHQLFMWFSSLTRAYASYLFKCYHHSFVKKDMNKNDIPYSMKPLCGELHKMYMSNKCPITNTMVEQFIFQMPSGKVFWRLFTLNNHNSISQ